MRYLHLLIILGVVCGGAIAQGKQGEKLRSEFGYDRNQPLDLKENSVEKRDGIQIQDISYASLKGGRVTAYLVVPSGKGKFAGIIFLHPGPGNRSTFLDEAVSLARTGVISLLIDAPYRRPEPWKRTIDPPNDPQNEREMYIQTVLDLRRGVDLLLSRRDIDGMRIGFAGHSFGATWGAVLAGVEKRIKAFVLIAGRPSLTDWVRASEDPNIIKARTSIKPDEFEKYLEILAPLDSIRYVADAAPSALFFQFARRDESVSNDESMKYEKTAGKTATVKWYDADHQGVRINAKALSDRTKWLSKKLGIKN